MFLRNRTSLGASLARAHLSERAAIAAIVVESRFRLSGERLVPCEERPPPLATDPPDISRVAPWSGVSVTAAGDVYGPRAAPFVSVAELVVGAVTRRLAIFGERRWQRTLTGELEPSAPAPFERLALSFSRAFGGSLEVPPGLFPGTDLPYPGGRIGYALNDAGVGFYLDKDTAEGGLLPSFELADHAITRWDDRPEPGCFVPCPDLVGLRIAPLAAAAPGPGGAELGEEAKVSQAVALSFLAAHHAPGYLIFDDVPAGTPVRLHGVGRRAMRFDVPPPPARVTLRRGRAEEQVGAALRSLHVDADQETVACVYGHAFRYEMDRAPSWVMVDAASS
ncbi:DUF2169 domain-containing protein [Sorangium sp. So ce321]|uniref:DUF2169 domain-containing protein n=1 Tax=Sorangium sp. So ce321 TaxID=3133300 RepID=UPI003F5F9FB8